MIQLYSARSDEVKCSSSRAYSDMGTVSPVLRAIDTPAVPKRLTIKVSSFRSEGTFN